MTIIKKVTCAVTMVSRPRFDAVRGLRHARTAHSRNAASVVYLKSSGCARLTATRRDTARAEKSAVFYIGNQWKCRRNPLVVGRRYLPDDRQVRHRQKMPFCCNHQGRARCDAEEETSVRTRAKFGHPCSPAFAAARNWRVIEHHLLVKDGVASVKLAVIIFKRAGRFLLRR